MKITKVAGVKKDYLGRDVGDERILVETNGKEAISKEDLFAIVKVLYKNEDKLYSEPKLGSRYLMLAFIDLRTLPTDEVLRLYEGRTKIKPLNNNTIVNSENKQFDEDWFK